MHYLWDLLLYHPLVNALAFLVSIVPGGDVGIAVILLTILVKLILFPLSQAQIRNQAAMNMLAPELNKIKASGVSKEEQAKLTFELYKKHKTNPFSGCLVMIPIIIVFLALYSVFLKGINFDSNLLYSFIKVPENVNMMFLGLIDISQKSLILAILAGISQYLQVYYMPQPPKSSALAGSYAAGSFAESFAKSMNMQMKYVFPVFVFIILYTNIFGISLSAAVALYWITNNLFTVVQQIYVNKTEKKVLDEEVEVLIAGK